MTAADISRGGWRNALAVTVQLVLLLVVVAGVLARIIELPRYVPNSGDEWGNTIAPFRVLYEGGDPGTYFHPSLYYYVTALTYAASFAALKVTGAVGESLSMTDLFVLDERYFVFAARAVSVLGAALAMWALYGLGKSLWDRQSGLLAAALLAVLPLHAVYSEAVRVDSFFLPVFIYAFSRVVRILHDPGRMNYDLAGFCIGLAAGTNYNGAVLVLWLIAAHVLATGRRPSAVAADPSGGAQMRDLYRALGLAGVGFLVSSPFVLINLETSLKYIAFISGLSVARHPGLEGGGFLFYADDLARTNPILCALIAVSSLAVALFGTRTERFVLSLPVAYFVLFSLVRTKFDRFILPALVLFLLVAGGLPFVLARRFGARRGAVYLSYTLSYALLAVCLATMIPQAIPVPRHTMLSRSDPLLFQWIESEGRPHANILVEAGVLPLIDTFMAPGRFAEAVRQSIVTVRPKLDHQFIGAQHIGEGSNYQPGVLAAKHIDYTVIAGRNVRDVERRCEDFPDVCAFYRQLREHGRLVFETPEGFESVLVYDVGSVPGPDAAVR